MLPSVLVATALSAAAERLPTRSYGLADGVPSTFVGHITMDSRGLLWLSTRDGLARFDGGRFVTYRMEHGLPVPNVSALLESRRGEYWVGTNGGGVCRMDSNASRIPARRDHRSPPLFRCTSLGSELADHVNALHEDAAGRIYAATGAGLFRLESAAGALRWQQIEFDASLGSRGVSALHSSEQGDLWIGTQTGVVRMRANGSTDSYHAASASHAGKVRDIARDAEGRIWVAFQRGLLVVRPRPDAPIAEKASAADRREESRWIDFGDAEMGESALAISSDGRVWVGTNRGLMEFDGKRFRRYGAAHGLTDSLVLDLAEDRDGNLWIAALSGLTKLTREGFITYDDTDGLPRMPIHALFEDAQGRVLAAGGQWVIGRFENGRFTSARPRLPDWQPVWASQLVFLDRQAGWWTLGNRLARFPGTRAIEQLRDRSPPIVYTDRDGLSSVPFRLFEDARGDVWIGARGQPGGLFRWERATGRLHAYPQAKGEVSGDTPSAFCQVSADELWIGFYNGGLVRYRYQEARFTRIEGMGVPGGMITAIHRDADGRLWIGSNQDGVTRVDGAGTPRPHFARYSAAEGLSSNNVRALASDVDGSILAGSVRGLDRLDPQKGVVRHYTMADGLAGDFITTVFRDRHGRVWVGTLNGLSQLLPARRPAEAPPVWIEELRIGGEPYPLSHLGQPVVRNIVLGPDRNNVEIGFSSVAFRPGQSLRYQYRVGVDDPWNAPTAERTVHYPRLGPGRYEFVVRAVTADGVVSAVPARVDITILPPFWQRWWFRANVVVLVGLIAWVAHRSRVRRVVDAERVRTRIASDLHDDIGSSLSQIAILSEVTRAVVADDARVSEPLRRIAKLSRESVDAMGDIVWAIDPHRDTPVHLAKRMRRLASELLGPCGIELDFEIAETGAPRLGPDVRREVFLIFKEALHNVVRHAQASRVHVDLAISSRRLKLIVQDNGAGGEATAAPEGQGLRSMGRRAESIGGLLDVQTRSGGGTRLTLTVAILRSRGAVRVPT